MLAHGFNVADQMLGCVVFDFGVGLGLSGTALIKQNYPVDRRIEKCGVVFRGSTARTTMQENHCELLSKKSQGEARESFSTWFSIFLAVLFVVQSVDLAYP